MNSWRKHTIIGLVICLLQLSLADVALSADTTVPNPSLTRQRVDQFGVGAKVKVRTYQWPEVQGIHPVHRGRWIPAGCGQSRFTHTGSLRRCRETESGKEHLQGGGPAGFR